MTFRLIVAVTGGFVVDRCSIELEIKSISDEGKFSGYGAFFGNIDSHKDIIVHGAFKSSIARMKRNSAKLPMLWQHKSDAPIGVFDVLSEDNNGLFVEGNLLKNDVQAAGEAYALLKAGAINGLSIGYVTKQYELDPKRNIRKLLDVDLMELSLVTFPSNDKARVLSVKADLPETTREFENFLVANGFSGSRAKAITASGYKASLDARDVRGEADMGQRDVALSAAEVNAILTQDIVLQKFISTLRS